LKKRSGIVGDLVSGVGGLVILVVIILVVVSTLLGANLLRETATTTTITDEKNQPTFLNATGYTLANYDSNNRAYSITAVSNGSDLTEAINSTSYTFGQISL